ncbi:hypothetical protein GCM10028895_25960 [Pontibacter rugosus]
MAFITTEITFKGQGDENFLDAGTVFKPMLQANALSSLGFDIRTDIVTYKDMYKVVPQRKVTRSKSNCGWNPYGQLAELIDDRIEVKKLGIEMEQCAEDFDGLILQTAKKREWSALTSPARSCSRCFPPWRKRRLSTI